MRLRDGIQTALKILYPPRCISCGEMVDSDFGLCGACWRETPFIGSVACDSCGLPLPGEAEEDERLHCDSCQSDRPPWNRGRAALLYREKARRLVLGLKYGDREDVVRSAALWLENAARPLDLGPDTLVAPIPLHWMRLLKRKYNQSALLTHAFCGRTGLAHCADLLQRPEKTAVLDGKSVEERLAETEGKITVNPQRKDMIAGRSVLLVDDVLTSGATLRAATKACFEANAKQVNILVLARAGKAT